MMKHYVLAGTIALAATAAAQAADPSAVQAPIQGSDALDGKNRSGPDGWSWAPQTRNQAPAEKTDHRDDPNSKPGPAAAKTLRPGEDPGTPLPSPAAVPATIDASPARKP